jgi:hypothetical protein
MSPKQTRNLLRNIYVPTVHPVGVPDIEIPIEVSPLRQHPWRNETDVNCLITSVPVVIEDLEVDNFYWITAVSKMSDIVLPGTWIPEDVTPKFIGGTSLRLFLQTTMPYVKVAGACVATQTKETTQPEVPESLMWANESNKTISDQMVENLFDDPNGLFDFVISQFKGITSPSKYYMGTYSPTGIIGDMIFNIPFSTFANNIIARYLDPQKDPTDPKYILGFLLYYPKITDQDPAPVSDLTGYFEITLRARFSAGSQQRLF